MLSIPYNISSLETVIKFIQNALNKNHKLFDNNNMTIRLVCEQLKHPVGIQFFMSTKAFKINSMNSCVYSFLGHYEQYNSLNDSITDIPKILISNVPEHFSDYFTQLQKEINDNFKELPIIADFEFYNTMNSYLHNFLIELESEQEVSNDISPDKFLQNIIDDLCADNTLSDNALSDKNSFDSIIEEIKTESELAYEQEMEMLLQNLLSESKIKEATQAHSITTADVIPASISKADALKSQLDTELLNEKPNRKLINKLRAHLRYYKKLRNI